MACLQGLTEMLDNAVAFTVVEGLTADVQIFDC